jgi:phosphohistidine phosphatase SixA
MMHLPALLLALGMATSDTTLLTPDSLMIELKKGGYVVLLRHARTDHSTMDNPNAPPTDRSAQRNLSADGIADARMIGSVFKKFGVAFAEVVSSPMFRTRETAELIVGHTDTTMALRPPTVTSEQRRVITTPPAPGTNRLLVTHHFVIEQNVTRFPPGLVNEGEAVVIRPTGSGQFDTVARIRLKDWVRLANP